MYTLTEVTQCRSMDRIIYFGFYLVSLLENTFALIDYHSCKFSCLPIMHWTIVPFLCSVMLMLVSAQYDPAVLVDVWLLDEILNISVFWIQTIFVLSCIGMDSSFSWKSEGDIKSHSVLYIVLCQWLSYYGFTHLLKFVPLFSQRS